jgi:hypothetical protein
MREIRLSGLKRGGASAPPTLQNAIVAFFNPRQVRSTARKTGDFIACFDIASLR